MTVAYGDSARAEKIAAGAVFGRDLMELRSAIVAQQWRCVGCGQVLELGAAVMTSIEFPRDRRVPAAAHAECRDGLRVLVDWESLRETLLLQIDAKAVTAASWAISRAYDAVYGQAK